MPVVGTGAQNSSTSLSGTLKSMVEPSDALAAAQRLGTTAARTPCPDDSARCAMPAGDLRGDATVNSLQETSAMRETRAAAGAAGSRARRATRDGQVGRTMGRSAGS